MSSRLGAPLIVGDLRLPNRVIMAPLTRSRAGAERLPQAPHRLSMRARVSRRRLGPVLKAAFGGVHIANEQFTQATAEEALAN